VSDCSTGLEQCRLLQPSVVSLWGGVYPGEPSVEVPAETIGIGSAQGAAPLPEGVIVLTLVMDSSSPLSCKYWSNIGFSLVVSAKCQ
jgi:hypothetical protein